MLRIKNLSVNVGDKKVLKNLSLDFELGKNYCILGKNGSGKSSLAMTIMGNGKYEVKGGGIIISDEENNPLIRGSAKPGGYDDNVTLKNPPNPPNPPYQGGIDILILSPDERAKLGIFLAFQHIPEIKGLKLFEFLRSIYNAQTGENASFLKFKEIILPILEEISLDKEFLRRDLNVGFSGGERRKVEVLQIKLLRPKYVFLDEIDSGLDIDAFKKVANMLNDLDHIEMSFVVITHYFNILDYIPIDWVYVMEGGKISIEGEFEIVDKIKKEGFDEIEK